MVTGSYLDVHFLLTAALCTALIFVNGWTDAPNAVATAVASGALRPRAAVNLAAVFNLLGVAVMYAVSDSLSKRIETGADFGGGSLTVLCAAMTAVVSFATAAWFFGIPTSEGHGLMAALAGGAAAMGKWERISILFGGVLWGIVATSLLGFLLGFALNRATKKTDGKEGTFLRLQRVFAAALAFAHGAQDGQKFTAVLLLGLKTAMPDGAFSQPWAICFCAAVMSLGTAMGGGRIIKKVGSGITKIDPRGGLACDISAFVSLFLCTILGLPVSTTHTKTAAVLGVGVSNGCVNFSSFGSIALAWVLTFPACFFIAYILTAVCV